MLDKYFSGKKKVYEVVFRLDFFELPSLYSNNIKGQLIKSAPITVRIGATSEKEALHLLDDIIKEETKGELVRIKEIKETNSVTQSKEKS
ncbi:MAG: hypothetical protein Q8O88_03755 [bacterium]|nr:hypothetical protein [bacterium]